MSNTEFKIQRHMDNQESNQTVSGTVSKYDSPWELKEAHELIDRILPYLKAAGFYPALTGSVLFQGVSKKDLDIIVYPANSSRYEIRNAFMALEAAGLTQWMDKDRVAQAWVDKGSTDRKHVEVWLTEDKKRVDIFFLS